MQGQPPKHRIATEHLLPVPSSTDVEFALGALFAFEVFYRGVIFQNELEMELDEIR
jgi:hypothetical protein